MSERPTVKQAVQRLIETAGEANVMLLKGELGALYKVRSDDGTLKVTKEIDHRSEYVCYLWGFRAKCSKCKGEACPKHRKIPVEHFYALTEYWVLVALDLQNKTVVVEIDRAKVETVFGAFITL